MYGNRSVYGVISRLTCAALSLLRLWLANKVLPFCQPIRSFDRKPITCSHFPSLSAGCTSSSSTVNGLRNYGYSVFVTLAFCRLLKLFVGWLDFFPFFFFRRISNGRKTERKLQLGKKRNINKNYINSELTCFDYQGLGCSKGGLRYPPINHYPADKH